MAIDSISDHIVVVFLSNLKVIRKVRVLVVTKIYQMALILFGSRYSRMDQVQFFKGCLPQILLGPFLNTLTHLRERNKYEI